MTALRFTLCLVLLQACSEDDIDPVTPDAGHAVSESPPAADSFEGCSRDELEADLQTTPLSAAIEPGEYLMATTYLQLKPDKVARFDEVGGPVAADIQKRSGLVAYAFGNSAKCSVARTLTVWRDEASMLEFVVGEAHAKAMQTISELSRGGSVAAHWTGDQTAATWDAAAEHLATTDRRMY